MCNTEKIIEEYLNFSGTRKASEIDALLKRVSTAYVQIDSGNYLKIMHIRQQLIRAFFAAAAQPNKQIDLEIIPAPIFKKEDRQLGKFKDTGDVPGGGRQDSYWNANRPVVQFKPDNLSVRKGVSLPDSFIIDDERYLMNYFALRGVEYGQWLTQQDRVNYLAAAALSMFDLSKVLELHPQQIGLHGLLTLAFGARGKGKALAHFEPGTFAINFTRFKRPTKVAYRPAHFDRSELIHFSGGVGTFCHEFGHALDYFAGMFLDPPPPGIEPAQRKMWSSLAFHRSLRTKPLEELKKKNTLRGKMERLMEKIIWSRQGEHTTYYKRVLHTAEQYGKNASYWLQRNELFARAFEVYVANRMHKKGWFNTFLQRFKYESPMYMTGAEFKTVEKEFDSLIAGLRSAIRSGIVNYTRLPYYQRAAAARKKAKH